MANDGDEGAADSAKELPRGKYVDSWVAYLDILGYRNLIRNAVQSGTVDTSIDRLRVSVGIPKSVYEHTWGRQESNAPAIRLLSDSVIVSAPTHACTCWWFVWTVNHLIASFSRHGLFLRGALARGGHYDDGIITFSPALVEAYEVERSEAVYPRVIVPASMRRVFIEQNDASPTAELNKLTEHLVWEDEDGRFFLNYLFRYVARFIGPAGPASAKPYLLRHKVHLLEGLQGHREDERIFTKYCWLREYHNRFCRFALDEDALADCVVSADSESSDTERCSTSV